MEVPYSALSDLVRDAIGATGDESYEQIAVPERPQGAILAVDHPSHLDAALVHEIGFSAGARSLAEDHISGRERSRW